MKGSHRLGKLGVRGAGQETLAELLSMCLFILQCSLGTSGRADMSPTASITPLWYLWGPYGSPFKNTSTGLMHEACWASWHGWVARRSSKPCARDRGVQILRQKPTAPHFLLWHCLFDILLLSPTHSQLLSHRLLRLFLILMEKVLQECPGSNPLLCVLLAVLFSFLYPHIHRFSFLPFPHYCGKRRKGNTSEMKD